MADRNPMMQSEVQAPVVVQAPHSMALNVSSSASVWEGNLKGATADEETVEGGWRRRRRRRCRCLEGKEDGREEREEGIPPEGIITSKSVHSHYHGVDGRNRAVLSGGRGGCALINDPHPRPQEASKQGEKRETAGKKNTKCVY